MIAQLVEFETAGGPVRVYLVPSVLEVSVDAGDRIAGPVRCDAVYIFYKNTESP